ncbi:disease resistance protein RUN1 [Ricinus communis]|uniref:disease resistance protein RUN1 n=1 Tax=Ricinus communis TaxID=3988 RepID=UPI00201B00F6|nr:disease resistance protein RUN1 [Ricinus communis]
MATSSFTNSRKHDVFLSFRGKDTRFNFTSHLYHALCSKGINCFIDGRIERGVEISHAIIRAIRGSRISIAVFSQDYASSSYCLDELLAMLSCNASRDHFFFPIFYKVDPEDVEKQTGNFGKAFGEVEAEFSGNLEKVSRWKAALAKAAKFAGWPLLDNGDEAKFIQSIVENVSTKLNRTLLHVAEHPVGLESHAKEVMSLLNPSSKDVWMVGICGTGGIGKTTIAKAIYNKIANQFEGSCFLENVRKTPEECFVQLQESLLIEVLGDKNIFVGNFSRGINCIKDRLCSKRVLIVIDDVDHVDQLKKLAAVNGFGAGSRIIITTRDERLLVEHGVKSIHKINELCPNDALVLFSWNAFKNPQPAEDYMELSQWIVNYAKGLPLALVVLGSFLYKRAVPEWESEIAKLKRNPNKHIYEMLKISYDGLDGNEKAIFLDIACFFKGMDKDVVLKILDACDFNPVIGVQVLIEKSLISIENNKIQMHALLQSMGRQVVCEQSPKPNKRSRLWLHEDVLAVLTGNKGNDDTEGILLDLPKPEEIQLSADAFIKMKSLRILLIRNAHITGGPFDLPNGLRWLEWPACPLLSMPSGICARKLVGLNMHRSYIREFGEEFKNYNLLKFIDLRDCEFLTGTPDFSAIPNLERLNLGGCSKLVEVHQSVGNLAKLEFLSFEFCFNLKNLPSTFKLRSLRTLLLTGCQKLEAFPEIVGEIKWLEKLSLTKTAIKGLPSSIANLTGLKVLTLTYCKNLTYLPHGIYKLEQLKCLFLEGCSMLHEFPANPNGHSSLGFPKFRCLDLRNCNLPDITFLKEHNCFPMLKDLDLSGNDFVSLPPYFHLFNNLRSLKLSKCMKVQEIPELPLYIKRVEARDCESLERFPQLARIFKCNEEDRPNRLHDIDFSNCHKLAANESKFLENAVLSKKFRQDLRIEIFLPGSEIPKWFSYRSEEDSLSFQVPSRECERIRALILCAILSIKDGETVNISRQVFINGQNVIMFSRQFFSLESNHVWLYYLPRRFIRGLHLKQNGDVHFEVSFKVLGATMGSTLKSCGVYLVSKQDEIVDDPSVTPPLSSQMESMSVDLKRSCDNDLERNLHSHRKKKRATKESLKDNNAEHRLEPPMPVNIDSQQGNSGFHYLCKQRIT